MKNQTSSPRWRVRAASRFASLTGASTLLVLCYWSFHPAMASDPRVAAAVRTEFFKRASAEFTAGDYDAAISTLENTMGHPPHPACHYLRGECFRKTWRLDQAVKDFDRTIEIDPRHASAHYSRGLIAEYRDYWDRALEEYDAAVQLDPNLSLPHIARGGIRWKRGELEQATNDLNRGIKLASEAILANPNDAAAYRARALALRTLRQFDRALEDHDQMIRLLPDSVEAHIERGRTHAAKYEQAMHAAQTGGGPEAMVAAERHKAASVADFDQAVRLATRLIEKSPDKPQGYRMRVEAFDARFHAWKDPEDCRFAVADLDMLARHAPACPTVFFRRGHLHAVAAATDGDAAAAAKHFDAALADLNRVIKLNPTFAAAWCERGLHYLRAVQRGGDAELSRRGVADLSEMIRLVPKEGRAYCARGSAHALLSDWQQALADANDAVRLCPQMPEAYSLRGLIHDCLKNQDAAHA
ncbi:MAG: tetratricopeptide repeat protein, partial [Pirellulaceae bacterium]|nr:tetratricopeptide repeat protein [Pirellulaceae bacterium]